MRVDFCTFKWTLKFIRLLPAEKSKTRLLLISASAIYRKYNLNSIDFVRKNFSFIWNCAMKGRRGKWEVKQRRIITCAIAALIAPWRRRKRRRKKAKLVFERRKIAVVWRDAGCAQVAGHGALKTHQQFRNQPFNPNYRTMLDKWLSMLHFTLLFTLDLWCIRFVAALDCRHIWIGHLIRRRIVVQLWQGFPPERLQISQIRRLQQTLIKTKGSELMTAGRRCCKLKTRSCKCLIAQCMHVELNKWRFDIEADATGNWTCVTQQFIPCFLTFNCPKLIAGPQPREALVIQNSFCTNPDVE